MNKHKLYNRILHLYPKDYRRRFYTPMMQTFLDRYIEGKKDGAIGTRFWVVLLTDEFKNIIYEHFILFFKGGDTIVNKFWFGLILGGLSSIAVILTNVTFASNVPDNGIPNIAFVVVYSTLIALSGYIASRKSNSLKDGAIGGASTSLITFLCIMVTFILVNNLFLSTVSQQADKIWGFTHQNTYRTMRDFINADNLQTLMIGLPVAVFIGAILGIMGRFFSNTLLSLKIHSN